MSEEIEKIEELVQLASSQKMEKSRLKGSLDIITKYLKAAGFLSVKDAKAKIETMKTKKDGLEKTLDSKVSAFRKKYEKYL